MLRTTQHISQKQTLQQRLSPQQIQYIKLLQLPTMAIEMRVKEELEFNPVLEDISDSGADDYDSYLDQLEDDRNSATESVTTDPVDKNKDIDWDTILHNNTEYEGSTYQTSDDDWRTGNDPYHESLLERLEKQISMLDLDEKQTFIAEQIAGSLDEDGYLRRDLQALTDSVAFHYGQRTELGEVQQVLSYIQRLDPPGIAARDLRECLLLQLERKSTKSRGRDIALQIVRDEWDSFEKKHFDKVTRKLGISEEELKNAYELILQLDPKPGLTDETAEINDYIVPDFEVFFQPDDETGEGDFVINLNRGNTPSLRISPSYKRLWDDLQRQKGTVDNSETRTFIRSKIESAKAFMDALSQRKNTLLGVMKTIVALQETFFRTGSSLKPMILKDVADRIGMDISTVSRIVNGKYVQTPFGVFELKYFFNESLDTQDGSSVSNREVKNLIETMIQNEDKSRPLSDDAITENLKKNGFIVARRTVTKYREQLNIPVARLRKQL